MKPAFIPGLKLAESFYWDIIRPILDDVYPGLPHAAGRVDAGSDVLGFDDEVSMDHDWGPRLMLFLSEQDREKLADEISLLFQTRLPKEFKGFPTNFSAPDVEDGGTRVIQAVETGPVNHNISIQSVGGFFSDYLGYDIDRPPGVVDWLVFPEQLLLTVTKGKVFHDGVGLNEVRSRLEYYPQDVWIYLMAAGWKRIEQEEHLMGRAGSVGDEIGSAVIGGRLVRDVMRLCFLMEKSYAPYPKWFGKAFKQLECGTTLKPILEGALHAKKWQERENHLVEALEFIAARHNALNITGIMPARATRFYNRNFRVIAHNGFAEALKNGIQDPAVKRIAEHFLGGSVDLISDNVDALADVRWRGEQRQFLNYLIFS